MLIAIELFTQNREYKKKNKINQYLKEQLNSNKYRYKKKCC